MATKVVKKEVKKAPRVKFTGFVPVKLRDFTISQKSSGRFAVVTAAGKPVNGEEKVKILLEAKILKPSMPKAPEVQAEAQTPEAAV